MKAPFVALICTAKNCLRIVPFAWRQAIALEDQPIILQLLEITLQWNGWLVVMN